MASSEIEKALADRDGQRNVLVVPDKYVPALWVYYQVHRGCIDKESQNNYIRLLTGKQLHDLDDDEKRSMRERIAQLLTFHSVMAGDRLLLDTMKRDLKGLGRVWALSGKLYNGVIIRTNARGTMLTRRAQENRVLPRGKVIDTVAMATDIYSTYQKNVPKTGRRGVSAVNYGAQAAIREPGGIYLSILVLGPLNAIMETAYTQLFKEEATCEFLAANLGTAELRACVTKGMKHAASYGLFRLGYECMASGVNCKWGTAVALSVSAASMYGFDRIEKEHELTDRLEGWIETAKEEGARKAGRRSINKASAFVKGRVGSAGDYVIDRIDDFL